jgi:hypothetical protein
MTICLVLLLQADNVVVNIDLARLMRGQTDHLGVPATRLMKKKKNVVAFRGKSNLNPTKVMCTSSKN